MSPCVTSAEPTAPVRNCAHHGFSSALLSESLPILVCRLGYEHVRTCVYRAYQNSHRLLQTNILRRTIYASLIWPIFTFSCNAELHVQDARFYLNHSRVAMTSYSHDLANALRGAEVIAIDRHPNIKDSMLLILRRSTVKLGLSRCGAGHEDSLALVAYSGGKIRLVDATPLQSCERNFSLVLPDLSIPDNPADAIKLDSDGLEFSTLNAEMTGAEIHRFQIYPSGFRTISPPSSDGH